MKQTATHRVTVNSIMWSREFKEGFADYRAGRFNPDRGPEHALSWHYERGWQFAGFLKRRNHAHVAKIPAERGRVPREFIKAFQAARREGDIL